MIRGPKYRGRNLITISIIGAAISHAYLDLLKIRGTKFKIIEKIIPRG